MNQKEIMKEEDNKIWVFHLVTRNPLNNQIITQDLRMEPLIDRKRSLNRNTNKEIKEI